MNTPDYTLVNIVIRSMKTRAEDDRNEFYVKTLLHTPNQQFVIFDAPSTVPQFAHADDGYRIRFARNIDTSLKRFPESLSSPRNTVVKGSSTALSTVLYQNATILILLGTEPERHT
jgi:hypothetical protein